MGSNLEKLGSNPSLQFRWNCSWILVRNFSQEHFVGQKEQFSMESLRLEPNCSGKKVGRPLGPENSLKTRIHVSRVKARPVELEPILRQIVITKMNPQNSPHQSDIYKNTIEQSTNTAISSSTNSSLQTRRRQLTVANSPSQTRLRKLVVANSSS